MPPGIGYGGFGATKSLLPFLGQNQSMAPAALAPGATMAPTAAPKPPGPEDFFGLKGNSSQGYAANIGAAGLSGIYGYGPQAQDVGFQTLLNILQGRGATDPRLLNQTLSQASLANQGQQSDLQGQLARLGLGGSGVGQAVGAAIGQGGANQRAQLLAQEAQLQEARKREDLNLLLSLILNPAQSALGMRLGVPTAPQGPSTASALLGAAGTGLGAYFGGPLGAAAGGSIGSSLGGLF